jgi:proteic killer suppression protein
VTKSFRHSGLERFFSTGSKAGIQPAHATRLRLQLSLLNAATGPGDIKSPGWRLRPLKGQSEGLWSIEVNGNWRLTFAFEGTDVVLLDYLDYH